MSTVEVYVPDDYSDIQAAIDGIPGGTTKYIIVVREGTYSAFTMPNSLPETVVRGTSKPIVDATGSSYGALVQSASAKLQDLDFTNATLASVAQDTGANDLLINRCTFRNSPTGFETLFSSGAVSGLHIRNCLVYGVTNVGIDIQDLDGECLVSYCTIHVDSTGASLLGDAVGLLVYGPYLEKLTVKNNIINATQVDRTAVCIEVTAHRDLVWQQNRNVYYPEDDAIMGRFGFVTEDVPSSSQAPPGDKTTLLDWQIATTRDGISFEDDPLFDDVDSRRYNLVQRSVYGRYGEVLGLADPLNMTDDDWQGVIRAADYPSIGAYEVHDVITYKSAGHILNIIAGNEGPVDRVVLGEDGLIDDDDIFRPAAILRDEKLFQNPVPLAKKSGATVTASVTIDEVTMDIRARTDPRNNRDLAEDRKITLASEWGLANAEHNVITGRRIRPVPIDPLLPNTMVYGGVIAGVRRQFAGADGDLDFITGWIYIGPPPENTTGKTSPWATTYHWTKNRVYLWHGDGDGDVYYYDIVTEDHVKVDKPVATSRFPNQPGTEYWPESWVEPGLYAYRHQDGKIYQFGGVEPTINGERYGGFVDSFKRYDPQTHTWEFIDPPVTYILGSASTWETNGTPIHRTLNAFDDTTRDFVADGVQVGDRLIIGRGGVVGEAVVHNMRIPEFGKIQVSDIPDSSDPSTWLVYEISAVTSTRLFLMANTFALRRGFPWQPPGNGERWYRFESQESRTKTPISTGTNGTFLAASDKTFEDLNAQFVTDGVVAGDELEIGSFGGGADYEISSTAFAQAPMALQVQSVDSETQLQVETIATLLPATNIPGAGGTGIVYEINRYSTPADQDVWYKIARVGPMSQWNAGLIHMPEEDKFLLISAFNTIAIPDQTWIYDVAASAWSPAPYSGSHPSARIYRSLWIDGVTKKVRLFGGWTTPTNDEANHHNDLWEYTDGVGWAEILPDDSPGAPSRRRCAQCVAYDSGLQRAVLFGGSEAWIPRPLNDTWELRSDNTWQLKNDRGAPNVPLGANKNIVYVISKGWVYAATGGTSVEDLLVDATWWKYVRIPRDADGLPPPDPAPFPQDPPGGGVVGRWTEINYSRLLLSPGYREAHMGLWDSDRLRVVIWGGKRTEAFPNPGGNSGSTITRNDMWEWDHTLSRWFQMSQVGTPPPRFWAAFAYDSTRKKYLLFGGNKAATAADPADLTDETWIFDVATRTWTQLSPATSPSARSQMSMVYDPNRDVYVLFGGDHNEAQPTWEFDPVAQDWTNRSFGAMESAQPRDVLQPVMAYNATLERVELFGGAAGTPLAWTLHNCLWSYDGVAWTQRSDDDPDGGRNSGFGGGPPSAPLPSDGPWPRSSGGMVFDTRAGRPILFGGDVTQGTGSGGGHRSDSFEFVFGAWELTGSHFDNEFPNARTDSPLKRKDFVFVYIPEAAQAFLYGGRHETDNANTRQGNNDLSHTAVKNVLDDVWTYASSWDPGLIPGGGGGGGGGGIGGLPG